MAKRREPQRGFLSRWYRRLRWLRRLALIGGIAGGVAKAVRRSDSGPPAIAPEPNRGTGGNPGPAAGAAQPSDDPPSATSAPAGGRALVSVPPLVDEDDDGDQAPNATVTEIGSGALASVESGADAQNGPAAPVLTIVSDTDAGAWVPPLENGDCPDGYPVKVNHNSGIFHVPGGRSYNRTAAQRCYATADAAAADGYRAAKA